MQVAKITFDVYFPSTGWSEVSIPKPDGVTDDDFKSFGEWLHGKTWPQNEKV